MNFFWLQKAVFSPCKSQTYRRFARTLEKAEPDSLKLALRDKGPFQPRHFRTITTAAAVKNSGAPWVRQP